MTLDATARETGRTKLGLFIAAAVVAAIWLSLLAVLALRTANPVTVNRGQLLASDAVVVATPRQGRSRGRVVSLRIDKSLVGEDLPATLQVGGVEPGRFSDPGPYLVPLRRTENGFDVTPAPPALNRAPLVYPATAEVVRMAEVILATAAAKPYE